MDQKYLKTPFALSGDQTAIPDPVQPSGDVSFAQGFTLDYQLDPATDPSAKDVPRDKTNYLYFVITQILKQYEEYGIPEWISAADNGGVAFSYAKNVVVRYSATVPATTFETYVSVVDGNTSTPGADANWQVVSSQVASSAEAAAGTDNNKIMTPARVAQQTLLRALLAGSTGQVFNVAAATARSHAVNAGQVQDGTLTTAAATGPANTYALALTPAIAAFVDGQVLAFKVPAANTTSATLNVNATGAFGIVGLGLDPLQGGELFGNGIARVQWNAVNGVWVLLSCHGAPLAVKDATQSKHAMNRAAADARYLQLNGGAQTVFGSVTYTQTLTGVGAFLTPNNVGYQSKSTGGAVISILYIDASNNQVMGSTLLNTTILAQSTLTTNAKMVANAGFLVPNSTAYSALTSGSAAIPILYVDVGNACRVGNGAVPMALDSSIGITLTQKATSATHAMRGDQTFGGPGQAHVTVSGIRAYNTTYVNDTGRPIVVYVGSNTPAGGGSLGLFISGLGESAVSTHAAPGGQIGVTGVIPPGGSYQIGTSGSVNGTVVWSEYR